MMEHEDAHLASGWTNQLLNGTQNQNNNIQPNSNNNIMQNKSRKQPMKMKLKQHITREQNCVIMKKPLGGRRHHQQQQLELGCKIVIISLGLVVVIVLSNGFSAPTFNGLAEAAKPTQLKSSHMARSDKMPDSIYKTAPLLFGADIITDYFTEPADRVVLPTKSTTTSSSSGNRASGLKNTSTRAPSLPKTTQSNKRSKRHPMSTASGGSKISTTLDSSMLSMNQEATAGALRDISIKSGISMDHVISSLGLVVEAMKQQTMAMQMISGQMAATKGSQSQAETKALLESFGEMLSNIKGAAQQGATKSTTIAEIVGGIKGSKSTTADDDDQQVVVVQQPEVPATTTTSTTTTSAPSTTTTTTTTTTTPKPSTTSTPTTTSQAPSSSSSSSTTTTQTPQTPAAPSYPSLPNASEGATGYLKRKMMPVSEAKQTVSSQKANGWRRLVPFDFYPYPAAETPDKLMIQQQLAASAMASMASAMEQEQAEKMSVQYPLTMPTMPTMRPATVATSPEHTSSYRSVGMPGYGSLAPAQQQHQVKPIHMDMVNAMMMQNTKYQMHPPHQQQQQQQQHQSDQADAMQLMQMMSESPEAGAALAMMLASAAAATNPMTTPAPAPSQSHRAPPMSMMIAAEIEQQHQQLQQEAMMNSEGKDQASQWMPLSQLRPINTEEESSSFSDEIPKSPAVLLGGRSKLFGMPTVTTAAAAATTLAKGKGAGFSKQSSSGLKIGQRPQFDPSNFQMLLSEAVQKKPSSNSATKSQQQPNTEQSTGGTGQEQQQEQSSNDLNTNASSEVGSKSTEGSSSSSDDVDSGDNNETRRPPGGKAPAALVPMSPQEKPPGSKQTSFSVLGGRFKITPHTQMLHYLLEPGKFLFQQALNQFMPMGPSGAPPGPRPLVGPPMMTAATAQQQQQSVQGRRVPRRTRTQSAGGGKKSGKSTAKGSGSSGSRAQQKGKKSSSGNKLSDRLEQRSSGKV